ncbi:lantibiotic dehydratase [Frankia sp. AgB1.9]|uniref:lantibiotic dehydratase n=1 Tax=unclassified Frankia TaxID=2632575 RepID=UPI0019324C64|nr:MULTISPECIES: lantibiotic dehydratase [unclassified Frankia]MBL7493720.1 lantibiotic dehydratase [Frankia sp. AgW1.1]MBL7552796.1 lantibiotic dehydratase [Frankia sp. AgB1.9]MBL7625398.1 lantibiotic dehydratase [Frankia sp. AgB1.8]
MYRYLDAALVRAPAWQPDSESLRWPNLAGAGATPASWRAWLDEVWQIPEFAYAVKAASPDLGRQVARLLSQRESPEAATRRAALSTLRYLLRASSRATPFGLLSGVAAVRIGKAAQSRMGSEHHAVVRADMAWVNGVIERWESAPDLGPYLTVTANNLAVRRAGHLLLEHRSRGAAGNAPDRVRVRATGPVLAVIEAARHPIQVPDLAAALASRFPVVRGAVIRDLIAGLVAQRFLISDLHPSTTSADPLGALLRALDALPLTDDSESTQWRAALHGIQSAFARHNRATDPAIAGDERARAEALMQGLHCSAGPAQAIDLRLGWDLTIPRTIAADAADAAAVLCRLARRPALSAGWVAWHTAFLERYGPRAVVPVLDVVDPGTGLGYPAGYLDSPHPPPSASLAGRDRTLLKLAQTCAMQGVREITLDDRLIRELSAVNHGRAVQPSTEITVRVHARHLRDLDEGQFSLHVTGVSRAAGTTAGRFLGVLNDADRDRMSRVYAGLPAVHDGAVLAMISAPPLHAKTENVARAPRIAEVVISLGEHPQPDAEQIPVTDLAVTADANSLHLFSVSRQGPVHTILPTAVDLAHHSQPLARFLLEAPVALAAPCAGFDWGAAHTLPFLPALRHGRVVLSPARWVLTASELPDQTDGAAWDDALAAWRAHRAIPRWVYLGDGDQCLRLDLNEPSHRVLLRAHLDRWEDALLRAAPTPDDLGWAEGRVHEIAIPVAAAGQAVAPVTGPREVTLHRHGHPPGCGGRLYLQLQGPADYQDTILIRHLPDLISRLGAVVNTWWFLRYAIPGDHLRIRFTFSGHRAGPAAEQISAWTEALHDAELISHATWETSFPETARFGGSAALDAAEAFFAADSVAALAQVRASAAASGPDPRALTSASLVSIAAGLIGDEADAMRWLVKHAATDPAPPPRTLYDQAVTLINPKPAAAALPALDTNTLAAWAEREATLATYRRVLDGLDATPAQDLLPDLLHLHHARMATPNRAAERVCLHLARAAALSWLARTRTAPRP